MTEQQQYITADNPHDHFHMMLNSWDDDLDTHEYRLLGHYARVAGQRGDCWEGVRTTARKLHMGYAKLIEVRDGLVGKGYLRATYPDEHDHESSIAIQVVYDWDSNRARYTTEEGSPNQKHPVSSQEHPRFCPETKEDLLIKNSDQDKDSSHAAPLMEGTPCITPGWHPLGADLESRASEQPVESQDQEHPGEYTELEQYILVTCKRQRTIPKTYREAFNRPVLWLDRKRDSQQGPVGVS